MRKHRKLVQILILSAVVVVGILTLADGLFEKEDPPPRQGAEPLDFTLRGLDGQAYSLSDFAGQPVIINFWGTFCPPCVKEMPMIESYYNQHKDKGLVVLGVNLNEAEVTVRSFVRDLGLTFPVILDKNRVVKDYGVYEYPTTFFITRDGIIQDVYLGELPESYLRNQVDLLLSS